ncbi:hypothetical protein PENSPDRAFT_686785 [Peniophora sp. CONT]|nr:hypothetical protein PENSPDRAFT_686785 [Peniophora sp. CONT]
MFPITCSSVGDIIAVAELIHKIVKALKDNKGAAQDYRDFVHGLEMMASVMEEVHRIARNSANGIIQDVVLDYARRCCVDLHRANELTSGFEILIRTQSSAVSNGVGVGDRLSRGARKLRWHFMKSSEAAEFTQRFRDYCSHIQLCVTLLNENTANFRAQQQQRRADLGVLTVREDIALLSASSSSRQGDIVRDLQALNTTSLSNTAVLAGRLYSMRETIARNSRLVSENLSVGRFTAVQRDIQIMTRKRFISIALPILVSWVALVIDSKLASSQVQLRQYTPWLALCTIVLHCLWMQAATIPRTVGYDEMNSIIFIDFIGDRMNLPLQICGTLDDFHDLIDSLFKRKKRKGWSFVLKQAFEIIESTSSNALTSWTWAEHVRVGAEIELAVVLRQISQGAPSIACPYCNAETLGGAADSAGDWLGW